MIMCKRFSLLTRARFLVDDVSRKRRVVFKSSHRYITFRWGLKCVTLSRINGGVREGYTKLG
jgi:hypothetical protein